MDPSENKDEKGATDELPCKVDLELYYYNCFVPLVWKHFMRINTNTNTNTLFTDEFVWAC